MARRIKCPTCRAEATWDDNPFRPFCSERCRLIDLGDWVDEKYRIPGRDIETNVRDDDDDEEKDEL